MRTKLMIRVVVVGAATIAVGTAACTGDEGGTLLGTGGGGAASSSGQGASSSSSGIGGNISSSSGIGGNISSSSGSTGGGGNCAGKLSGVIRDFKSSHPDFEYVIAVDPGIVAIDLGADSKPVYAGNPTTPTTNGQASFDQWYRDVSGVNTSIPLTITLTDNGGGIYTYDNGAFFPIDGQGWGDEGNSHNFHFTYEIHTSFPYEGGEVFNFTGDDDLFVFVNGKLGMDLGGVHGAMSASIDLDADAAKLGISPGNTYPLDFFFAERHTSESNFHIETTIGCFVPPPVE